MAVIDASAVVELLINGSRGQRLRVRLAREDSIEAPHLIDAELLHALRRFSRRGKASVAWCERALDQWKRLPVDRYGHHLLLDRIWALRHNVSAYDAAYVALAEARSTVLLTADHRLAGAPGLKGRIELI